MNAFQTYNAASLAADKIEIDATPGCDTSVKFAVTVREIIPDPGPASPKRSLRILCVDDDPHIREFMNACLVHYDHQVMVASGGQQGLEMFRAATMENQPYDAVITDLGMPDIDGHQLARTIKAEFPTMPIIMMTGWGATESKDENIAAGVDVVVAKPPHMGQLNELLLRMAAPAGPARKEER